MTKGRGGEGSTPYLDWNIFHQQLSEALPVKPQSSTWWDGLIDFSGLHVQKQESALIHFRVFWVYLDLQKPFTEAVRETLLQFLERPVDRYSPPLEANISMPVTLEDGETDAILYLTQLINPARRERERVRCKMQRLLSSKLGRA